MDARPRAPPDPRNQLLRPNSSPEVSVGPRRQARGIVSWALAGFSGARRFLWRTRGKATHVGAYGALGRSPLNIINVDGDCSEYPVDGRYLFPSPPRSWTGRAAGMMAIPERHPGTTPPALASSDGGREPTRRASMLDSELGSPKMLFDALLAALMPGVEADPTPPPRPSPKDRYRSDYFLAHAGKLGGGCGMDCPFFRRCSSVAPESVPTCFVFLSPSSCDYDARFPTHPHLENRDGPRID